MFAASVILCLSMIGTNCTQYFEIPGGEHETFAECRAEVDVLAVQAQILAVRLNRPDAPIFWRCRGTDPEDVAA